jgi:hypothetical protein
MSDLLPFRDSNSHDEASIEQAIASIDNDQVLDLFEVLCADVARRVDNYRRSTTAPALLDGLKFSKRAAGTCHDLYFGYRFSTFDASLAYAPDNFTEALSNLQEGDDA